ncbi:(R)-mandelonitrile beta-glucosyltransferase-like [Populus nigra]|uniref:(R)-mandelonitrile beta-glucosyltransferase-like n=1 Tax=Populus nigra TaxID=3691 RepID=UPI002B2750A0|nr:(R)-mandelonitrile beta-glucosyltransferase-like [Populus nigra]
MSSDESYLTNGYLESIIIEGIPGMKPLQLQDFPYTRTIDPDDFAFNFVMRAAETSVKAHAIAIHTIDALEQDVLDGLPTIFPRVLWKEEDERSLQLLDTKEPKSVLYVNFGSIWSLATQQSCQLNLKWKLRNVDFLQTDVFKRKYQAIHDQVVDSQHIVVGVQLWRAYLLDFQRTDPNDIELNFAMEAVESAVKAPTIILHTHDELEPSVLRDLSMIHPCVYAVGPFQILPPEFAAEIQKRGLIARWCPQEEVLSTQPSISWRVLTHCGWGSTIESLSAEVPKQSVSDGLSSIFYRVYAIGPY